jgi:hypothetical protein
MLFKNICVVFWTKKIMVKAVRNAYNMSIVMTDQCLELLNWSSAEPIYLWLWLVPWRILCLSDCVESLLIYWLLVTIWLIKVICYTYINIVKNLSDAHAKSLSQTQTKSSTNPHPHKYSDLKLNRFYTLTVCNSKQWIINTFDILNASLIVPTL